MFDNDQELVKKILQIKGNRTLREFGADTGVSYSHIQRILKNQKKPGPEILRKLSKGDRNPQADVSYDDLMVLAGYINQDIAIKHNSILDDERFRNELFRKMELTILDGLIGLDIPFRRKPIRKRFIGFEPDLQITLENEMINKWYFKFLPHGKKPVQTETGEWAVSTIPLIYGRQFLAETVLIETDFKRKISLITDKADYYSGMKRFKGQTSYAGNVSIILIDSKNLEILCEDNISTVLEEEKYMFDSKVRL